MRYDNFRDADMEHNSGGSLEFEVMKQARSFIKENSHIAKSSYRTVLNLQSRYGPVLWWAGKVL